MADETPPTNEAVEIVDGDYSTHPTFSDKVSEQVYAFKLLMTETDKIKDPALRDLGVNMMGAMIRIVGGEKTPKLSTVRN
jgi:hypothetical protein